MSAWGISDIQIATIDAIVSVFESERPGDYGAVARDPKDAGGLSYGKHQAALTKGTLYNLISQYCANTEAQCAAEFTPFLPKIEARDRVLDTDKTLYSLLKKAAFDPVMQKVQDTFFNDSYMKPALAKWQSLGFRTALSAAVIYDSYIHSGGLNMMNRTVAKYGEPKAESEKEWIAGYVATRKEWLTQNYPATAVRMKTFEALLADQNWDLKLPLRIVRNAGSYPLTAYDLGAHLFDNAIRRLGKDGFGVAKLGDALSANGRDRFVQASLAGLGYLPAASVDGKFGKATQTAVKAFQKDCKLDQTGEVDGKCFDKLCAMVEEKGATGADAAQPTDHGLVELPPEKRTSATSSKVSGGVAAGAAGVAGVAGAAAGSSDDKAASDATAAATPEAPAGLPVGTATDTAAAIPAAPAPASSAAPAAAAAPAPAAAPASPPPPTDSIATPAAAPPPASPATAITTTAADHKLNILGAHIPEGILALSAAALFLLAIILFAHGRRKSY